MKRLLVIAGALCLVVVACTTTEKTTDHGRESSPTEAAKFNSQLAIEYLKQHDLAAAEEKIERALKQDPNNVDVQTTAALVYEQLKNDKKVEQHYSAALRIKPDDPEVLNNYGVYLCRQGRARDGEKMFLRAAKNPLYKTPDVAYTNAGVCLRRAGELDDAQKSFQQALALRPKSADALMQLADLKFERGEMAEASALVQRYVNALPANPQVLWLGVRVERALKNQSQVDAYARRLKTEFPKANETRALLASEHQGG